MKFTRLFQKNKQTQAGFTLLEILLVVAMIAILAGIVIFAINPSKQLASARNAQRRADVNTIANAVYQYAIDNDGVLPATITSNETEICRTSLQPNCTNLINLGPYLTLNEKYLTSIPNDPAQLCLDSDSNSACYTIFLTSNNRVTVSAPYAELDATIRITR